MSVAFGMDSDFQLKGNKTLTKEACRWFELNPIVFLIGKKRLHHFYMLP